MEPNEIKISSILNIGFNTVQSISGRTSLLFENKFKTHKRCRRIDRYRYLVLCKKKSDSFNVIVQSCITTSKEIGAASFSHLPFISPTRSNESWTYRHKNWTIHGWNGPMSSWTMLRLCIVSHFYAFQPDWFTAYLII